MCDSSDTRRDSMRCPVFDVRYSMHVMRPVCGHLSCWRIVLSTRVSGAKSVLGWMTVVSMRGDEGDQGEVGRQDQNG